MSSPSAWGLAQGLSNGKFLMGNLLLRSASPPEGACLALGRLTAGLGQGVKARPASSSKQGSRAPSLRHLWCVWGGHVVC